MALRDTVQLMPTLAWRQPLGQRTLARPPLGRFTSLSTPASATSEDPLSLAAYLVGMPILEDVREAIAHPSRALNLLNASLIEAAQTSSSPPPPEAASTQADLEAQQLPELPLPTLQRQPLGGAKPLGQQTLLKAGGQMGDRLELALALERQASSKEKIPVLARLTPARSTLRPGEDETKAVTRAARPDPNWELHTNRTAPISPPQEPLASSEATHDSVIQPRLQRAETEGADGHDLGEAPTRHCANAEMLQSDDRDTSQQSLSAKGLAESAGSLLAPPSQPSVEPAALNQADDMISGQNSDSEMFPPASADKATLSDPPVASLASPPAAASQFPQSLAPTDNGALPPKHPLPSSETAWRLKPRPMEALERRPEALAPEPPPESAIKPLPPSSTFAVKPTASESSPLATPAPMNLDPNSAPLQAGLSIRAEGSTLRPMEPRLQEPGGQPHPESPANSAIPKGEALTSQTDAQDIARIQASSEVNRGDLLPAPIQASPNLPGPIRFSQIPQLPTLQARLQAESALGPIPRSPTRWQPRLPLADLDAYRLQPIPKTIAKAAPNLSLKAAPAPNLPQLSDPAPPARLPSSNPPIQASPRQNVLSDLGIANHWRPTLWASSLALEPNPMEIAAPYLPAALEVNAETPLDTGSEPPSPSTAAAPEAAASERLSGETLILPAQDAEPDGDEAQLERLAGLIYRELRSHLCWRQEPHCGNHSSLTAWLPAMPSPTSRGLTHQPGLPLPPPLLRLTTVVRQQVESRLRQDRERQSTPDYPFVL